MELSLRLHFTHNFGNIHFSNPINFFYCVLPELLEYLDGLIKEYDKYVDEDGNLREDVTDKQSTERAVEEIQLRYNSFVNKNPILRELSQKDKENPPGSQVCISPVKEQSGDDIVIVGGEEITDSIITDKITIDNITAYTTNQMELNEPIATEKDKYNICEDIVAHEEKSVDERTIIGITTIGSSVPVSPKNDTITNKIRKYYGENNVFNTNQGKLISPIADGAGYYKNTDGGFPDVDETLTDRSINVDRSQPSSSENDNRRSEQRQSDKTSQGLLQACHLERSVSISKADKLYKCQICDSNLQHSSKLISHKRIHTGEKTYKCKVCGQSFTRSSSLKHYVLRHTGEKPFKCTACDKCFWQKSALTTHMLIHTGEKPFKCFECEKSFPRKDHLTIHMQTHNREKQYRCTTCKKSFKHQSNLKMHMRIHTGEQISKCDTCNKLFTSSYTLRRHVQIHTGEKPYKCFECGKCFQHKHDLTVHMRTHTGERPYKCTVCKKSFAQKCNLHRHMGIHTGEKL